jgi:hypothetical protein
VVRGAVKIAIVLLCSHALVLSLGLFFGAWLTERDQKARERLCRYCGRAWRRIGHGPDCPAGFPP